MSPEPTCAAAAARLARCRAWIRAWTPATPLRWLWRHQLVAALLMAVTVLLAGAAQVQADPSGTGASASGGTPLISWMGITDSHGVAVAKYTLTLNEGTDAKPWIGALASLDSLGYEFYLCVTTSALWLIRTVLSFKWLGLFAGPFETIGSGVGTAMDRFGLAPTALAILAIIAAFTVLAGRAAKAASNIAMGLLMVGVAATIFAHPLSQMIGPDGMLAAGRDTGLDIASMVSGGKDLSDPDQLVSSLADRFLRSPTQMINFGMVSDSISRKCEQAWTNGINNDRGDKLKDDMKGCDSKKGPDMHAKTMENPVGIMVSLAMVSILGGFLIAFACFFVWHVVRTAVHALLYAALAPPAFAVGVIPGGPQLFAWKTVLDCLMAYIAMIVYTAAFGAYNAVLDRVFHSTPNAIEAIFLTALVIAMGFAFFGPLRKMFDRQRDTMAAKISQGSAGGGASAGGAQRSSRYHKHVQRSAARGTKRAADSAADAAESARDAVKGMFDRGPGRIDTEAESASGASLAGDSATPAAEGPASVEADEGSRGVASQASGDPVSATAAAGSTSFGAGAAGAAAVPVSGGHSSVSPARPAAHPVAFLDRGRAVAAHDRLDAAIRIQRGSGRGPAGPGPGGGGGGMTRHALSEAA